MKLFKYAALTLLLCAAAAHASGRAADGHSDAQPADSHAEAGGHEGEVIEMRATDREAMGIRTLPAGPRALAETASGPGEVRLNAYRTVQVTPRISAQVVARHAHLGEEVRRDQPLVTLSSVALAEAQGALIESDGEWARVRKLGREVVSDKRYVAAQVARQRAYATVRAYGMTEVQIAKLLADGDASRATGEFDLLSPQDGTVIRDPFVVGEVVDPGRVLFEVSDESVLWVEAQLRPEQAAGARVGMTARVSPEGTKWFAGKVVQLHHRLDDATRTQGVRIEIDNASHVLHPGEYVEAALEIGAREARVAVPDAAVVLMRGTATVFKAEGDEFHPQVVEAGVSRGGWTEITAGLAPGEVIVTEGAFLLKSLALKSQMGEGHGH